MLRRAGTVTAVSSQYTRLLRDNPDFRRLYFAQLISFAGDWFLTVPLLGLVFELTGSEVITSLVFVAETLPVFLLSPLTGAAADRWDRRKILIAADLGRVGAVLALLFVDDLRSPGLALGAVALVAVGSAFFFPASQSALPNLVEGRDLATANVLLGSAWGTMAAVGAALGGLLADAVSRDVAFGVDAATFLLSAALVWRVRRSFSERRDGQPRATFAESIRETIRFARSHPAVAALLTSKAGFGLVAGAVALFPLISIELFDAGDSGTGLLFGARGLGALTGPFLVKRWFGQSDRRLVGTIGYSIAFWGIGYVALSQAPVLWLALVAVAFAHVGGGNQWAMSTYGLQVTTPDAVRGRIMSADFGLVTLAISISFLTAGALASLVGVRPVVAGSGLLGMMFGLAWAGRTRRYWQLLDPAGAGVASDG